MNKKNYLKETNFMSGLGHFTVSHFLFKLVRSPVAMRRMQEEFDEYIHIHLEEITLKELIPIDAILNLIEIEDVVEYTKKEFLRVVREDNGLLPINAQEVLIYIIMGRL